MLIGIDLQFYSGEYSKFLVWHRIMHLIDCFRSINSQMKYPIVRLAVKYEISFYNRPVSASNVVRILLIFFVKL